MWTLWLQSKQHVNMEMIDKESDVLDVAKAVEELVGEWLFLLSAETMS